MQKKSYDRKKIVNYLKHDKKKEMMTFFEKLMEFFFVQKTRYLYKTNLIELQSEKINPKFFVEKKL